MNDGYAFLGDVIVILHLMYVLFAIGGQCVILIGRVSIGLLLETRRSVSVHLAAVAIVALEASAGLFCPLTEWEYSLRQLAGQTVDRDISFVGAPPDTLSFMTCRRGIPLPPHCVRIGGRPHLLPGPSQTFQNKIDLHDRTLIYPMSKF